MKRILRYTCFVVLFCSFSLNAVIILTHGAFGEDQDWYQPGGAFYEAVNQTAQAFETPVISFTWEQYLGGITHKERFRAGKALAELVVDLTTQGETDIIFIGHSYGGHVVKVASQILAIGLGLQDGSRPIIVPERGVDFDKTELDYFKDICTEFKDYADKKNFKEIVQKRNFRNSMGRPGDFLIDHAYTLGTPNDIPDYFASMDVVGCLYNFYSKGDWIQEMVGDRKLPEPKHDWAVNLEVRIKTGGFFNFISCNKPGHMALHAEVIGNWILYIPFFLKEENVGNFNKFTFNYDAQIKFSKKRPPIYTCKEIGLKNFDLFETYNFEWLKNKIPLLKKLC
ncbi:MAG: hypothetical protein ABIF12_02830 [bacterium]